MHTLQNQGRGWMEKLELNEKFLFRSLHSWRDEKRKSRGSRKKKLFIFAFLIQFSRIVVVPYCSLSGLVLCMLFYSRTYNQYYFNYSFKFLLIKHSRLCFTFFPTPQPSINVVRLFWFPGKPSTFAAAFYPAFLHSAKKPQTNISLFKLNCIHAAWKSIAIYFVIRKQACDWSFSRAADIGYFM